MISERKTSTGFTLIELLAVLVIMGMATAIVVPMLAHTGDLNASAAARQLSSDLMYAQNYAITYQTPVRVTFDTIHNQYTLTAVPAVGAPFVLTNPVTGRNYVVGYTAASGLPSVAIGSTTFTGGVVQFDSLGSPNMGGAVNLTSQGVTKTVNVAVVTGKITIQ